MRSRVDPALLSALAVGLVVRLARIARAPLIHPDGPAYLALASDLLHGDVRRVLESYYSPAYPGLVAIAIAAGGSPEVAGRLATAGAGLAALPLLHTLTRRLLGARAAGVAVLTAALHPALVKAAADVLPETLAGAFLLAWLVVLVRAQGTVGLAAAGALAGAAYLARPEGVLLVPLGVAWAVRRQHRAALVAYVVAALLVMSPALVALHARSGLWQLSPREARLAATAAVGAEPTLVATLVHHPVALLARTLVGGATQLVYDAKALGVLLAVPFVVGLAGAAGRATVGPLLVAACFTALPLALNPSPRYAVPLVPLLLPSTAAGLLALGERLGRRARPVAAALAAGLVVQALWISHPFDAACAREVQELLLERYGPGESLVAVDGRFAYRAHGRPVVPRTTAPDDALALARRESARLWLTRPSWLPPDWRPPPDARPVARPCGGTFVLFELARS